MRLERERGGQVYMHETGTSIITSLSRNSPGVKTYSSNFERARILKVSMSAAEQDPSTMEVNLICKWNIKILAELSNMLWSPTAFSSHTLYLKDWTGEAMSNVGEATAILLKPFQILTVKIYNGQATALGQIWHSHMSSHWPWIIKLSSKNNNNKQKMLSCHWLYIPPPKHSSPVFTPQPLSTKWNPH